MKLTYSAYLELPAPLEIATMALNDPSLWTELSGATPLGALWRFGDELYSVQASGDPTGRRWTAEAVTGLGPRLTLDVSLTDATITTHGAVAAALELPPTTLLWRRGAAALALRSAVNGAASRLSALLQARRLELAPARLAAVPVEAGAGSLGVEPAPGLEGATPAQSALVERLSSRYPQTVEHFLAMGALEHLERVARLEEGWERIMRGAYDAGVHSVVATAAPARLDYELIYAGGGLGLLHAAVMAARHGRRVMLFDRSEVGCAHREWNISREELEALVATGVVSWHELEGVVMREYRDGLVRFFNRPGSDVHGGDLWMPEVLNVALDAGALLRLMRRKLEAAGGVVLSGRAFRTVRAFTGPSTAVEVELQDLATGAIERHTARLLLDGMGSTSPLALRRHAGRPFAGVCPTVGTVAAGFAEGDGPDEVDLSTGDILVTVNDAQRGEQLMWEGFPGRGDELTVYLFYYSTIATAGERTPARGLHADSPRYSLLDLFEQYFTLLPTYKRAGPHFQHLKPVYGYIPARHSLRAQEAPLLAGVLPVGDSAAQQSPLTFCGFGSHVRNLRRTTGLLNYALDHDLLGPGQLAAVNAFQTNVSLNWVFSRFMHPWRGADDVNRLQNLFLEVLGELGVERATRFYRDQMRWGDYHPMLFGVLRRWPQILIASWGVLGPRGIAQWAGDYLRFSAVAAGAAGARAGGGALEGGLTRLADALGPGPGLRVRARYAEWRTMGWLA